MAHPVRFNTISYVIDRHYDDRCRLNKSYTRNKLRSARSFYRKDLLAHYGCVNAIEFSHDGKQLVSGGDDRRVLLWDVDRSLHDPNYKPKAMRAQHISNIFCLAFNGNNEKIFSAGNDDQVIVHDVITGEPAEYYLHEQPVYGLTIDPTNDNLFASACDDGRILLFDTRVRGSNDNTCLATYTSAFHGVMYNPVEPRLLATANSKEGIALWDVRRPGRELFRYGGENASQSCMSVRFNQQGTHILALRRRLPPILYHAETQRLCAQFDHPGYYNSCTMKSCSFAGEHDEFVLSGSDDFNLYMWKIPSMQETDQWVSFAHMILKGHRSIVNQVRFNASNSIIASSGVEKLIKFWSPFQLPDSTGGPIEMPDKSTELRKVYTHEEYISLVLQSGQFMSHDYSQESTLEDPRMMAFFDSLVQREIEGWSSDDSAHSVLSAHSPLSEHSENSVPINQRNWPRAIRISGSDSQSSGPDVDDVARALVEALQAKHRTPNNNTEAEAEVPEQSNRITQLIAKKRDQLMKLARAKINCEARLPRKKKRQTTALTRFGISNSSTTSSSDTSSESETCSLPPTSSNSVFKKSNGVSGVKRLPSSSSSQDSDTTTPVPVQQRKKKRQKLRKTSASSSNSVPNHSKNTSDSDNKKSENLSSGQTSVPNHNALKLSTISSSHDSTSSLDDWDKPGLSTQCKKYSATPDSGIDLSASRGNGSFSQRADDSNEECEKLPVFVKSCKNRLFKRNYRSRIATDSDSD